MLLIITFNNCLSFLFRLEFKHCLKMAKLEDFLVNCNNLQEFAKSVVLENDSAKIKIILLYYNALFIIQEFKEEIL